MSILDMSQPSLEPDIDLSGFHLALDWLLDFNASNTPAPSSIAGLFWMAQDQLQDEYWSSEEYHALQSLIAFPLWFFQPNNYGNIELRPNVTISTLPPEFYTTAAITTPYTKLVVNQAMFCAFLILEGTVLVFLWVVPIWLCLAPKKIPNISSFSLLDFAFKTNLVGLDGGVLAKDEYSRRLLRANGKTTREICKEIRVTTYKED